MSSITDFFISGGKDHKGRTLEDMLSMSDMALEGSHDIIQWMFPLHERSYHSTTAPVLTKEDIEELRQSDIAKVNMIRLYDRMRKFFGIEDDKYERKLNFWCHAGNHNLLRITRIIRSLRFFGLDSLALYAFSSNQRSKEKTRS